MPIFKSAQTPNGGAVDFHKPHSANVSYHTGCTIINVASWPNEAAYVAGLPHSWLWAVPGQLADLADVEAALVGIGPFVGGSILPDAAATLAGAKARAWARIKAERERRLAGTFTYAGRTYDIDPTNLAGASIDAREALIAGEPWAQLWVLADNTVVALTAPEMIAVGRACKTAVSSLWATSQYLRGLIEAATTITQVEVITWP